MLGLTTTSSKPLVIITSLSLLIFSHGFGWVYFCFIIISHFYLLSCTSLLVTMFLREHSYSSKSINVIRANLFFALYVSVLCLIQNEDTMKYVVWARVSVRVASECDESMSGWERACGRVRGVWIISKYECGWESAHVGEWGACGWVSASDESMSGWERVYGWVSANVGEWGGV
jgi:hypothetical protein